MEGGRKGSKEAVKEDLWRSRYEKGEILQGRKRKRWRNSRNKCVHAKKSEIVKRWRKEEM